MRRQHLDSRLRLTGTVVEEPARYLEPSGVLWRAAALKITESVVTVLAVREFAVRILHPDPAFTPLSFGSPLIASIVCTVMAIYIFCWNRLLSEPGPDMA